MVSLWQLYEMKRYRLKTLKTNRTWLLSKGMNYSEAISRNLWEYSIQSVQGEKYYKVYY